MTNETRESIKAALIEFIEDRPNEADERWENIITPTEILQLIAGLEAYEA